MAVGGDDGAVDAVHMVHQILDFGTIFGGQTIAGGVRDIHHGGTGLDDGLHHPGQVFVVGASSILGIELHIVYITACILHGSHSPLDNLLAVAVELVLDVCIARSDASVYALALGIFQRFGSHVDILLHGSCQGADGGPGYGLGNLDHRVEISRTGDGESCLDDIDAKLFKLLGHLNFLHGVQLASWHLFTVSQCRVKNKKSVTHIRI